MDRPHLVGWGSLHRFRRRSLTSLCHRPGTASPVPEPEGSWLDPHLAACVLRSPVRPRPPPCRTLRDDMSSNRDAFRRVVTDRVAPTVDSADAFWFECAARLRPPFSPWSRRLVCQHGGAESSLASVALPICLAAPRASRRAMRQTDFCLLTFFVPVPAPRRFSTRHALARLRESRTSPASRQCDSLRWDARLSWCHRGGRCFPVAMRAIRTSGIPVASFT